MFFYYYYDYDYDYHYYYDYDYGIIGSGLNLFGLLSVCTGYL